MDKLLQFPLSDMDWQEIKLAAYGQQLLIHNFINWVLGGPSHSRLLPKTRRNKYKSRYAQAGRQVRRIFSNINGRCYDSRTSKYNYYGGKGIKNYLTREHLWYLWIRDHASEMLQPSIDRNDTGADYAVDNCSFIEFAANRKKR